MKIMTILGTRPEIIRLSLIIKHLDQLSDQHVLVHTGQNYDHSLSQIFFDQMGVRRPDHHIRLHSHSFGQQMGQMFTEVEKIIHLEKPEKILLLGDTNSALCAILGERLGIPVYHMEAGNRCFDKNVPEEINRKLIDSVASFNLPYTNLSRDNLLREGIPSHRIWVSGNPIYEVLQYYEEQINERSILKDLSLEKEGYILLTAHRAENVDNKERLTQIIKGLELIADQWKLPIVCSIHPRTKNRLEQSGIKDFNPLIQFHNPFGFFDFVHLQKNARCVITDSGTVQEESCIFRVPAVTIRQSTERPETILCGSNVLSGLSANRIAECVQLMMNSSRNWSFPDGYTQGDVSKKVVQFVLGGLHYV